MRFRNLWGYWRIIFSKAFASAVWHGRKNIISDSHGMPPVFGPYMAELDITYRCNCRCWMCQRWRDPRGGELGLDEYNRLARVLNELTVHQISVAGGEPLLRKDVFSIIEGLSKYGMSVNLCTNGILLEEYLEEICDSGATCITVSLDGATAKCHDEIRGVPGSFQQIERGIEALLERSHSNRPMLRVRMTISNRNLKEVGKFYRRWVTAADDVLLQPVHYCADAYYTGPDETSLCIDHEELARQIKGTRLEKDGYMRQLLISLQRHGTLPKHRCYAGVLMARIDPWGNVYPCLEQHKSVGSVRDQDFQTIWYSEIFDNERRRIASDKKCACWYNNTAMIGHYGRLLEGTSRQALWYRTRNLLLNESYSLLHSRISKKL